MTAGTLEMRLESTRVKAESPAMLWPTRGRALATNKEKATVFATAAVMMKSPPKKAIMVQSSSAKTRSGLMRRVVRSRAAATMAAA